MVRERCRQLIVLDEGNKLDELEPKSNFKKNRGINLNGQLLSRNLGYQLQLYFKQ